ncbi:hypothetical protein [Mycobacterium sp. 155]|uniref:hypothetical protein n=1 Tax=Mycobacterium sp. 155 TaxID=1157943 RepID=UPI00035CF1BB|nr:hypothetical protein [Mycobacterium sp. 155]
MSGIMNDGVSNPITPEQSKAQVIDAARDIVGTVDLQVVDAVFWHGSCNDQGDAPFQGKMRIAHPLAASLEAADAEDAQMIQRLEASGWTTDSAFNTHSTALKKNGVTAVFRPQNSAVATRGIDLYGECRDVTTTKQTAGGNEHVDLSRT